MAHNKLQSKVHVLAIYQILFQNVRARNQMFKQLKQKHIKCSEQSFSTGTCTAGISLLHRIKYIELLTIQLFILKPETNTIHDHDFKS